MKRNAWHRGPLLAWDTETTGPDPHRDRIVTCTTARIQGGLLGSTSWLIAPDIPISDGAAAVHGITDQHAREHGQDPATALRQIADELQGAIANGVPLVAFNASFDTTILERELTRHGIDLDLTQALVIDPFVIWKRLDRYRKGKRTLTAACEAFGVRLDGAHDATEDALAAARVAWVLAERYPDELQIDLAHLHANQRAWKADQAVSLQAYFDRQGKNEHVAREWPIQPAPQGWTPDQLPAPREEAA